MNEAFKRQVFLVLDTLPEVAKEECFALHGGTAINLFARDMPRLSVDIDLTYVPIANRESSISDIVKSLAEIETRIKKIKPSLITSLQKQELKLQISHLGAQIKIEVNQINRGCISDPENRILCNKAQEMFDAFCEIKTVPNSQLFGGKIIRRVVRNLEPLQAHDQRLVIRILFQSDIFVLLNMGDCLCRRSVRDFIAAEVPFSLACSGEYKLFVAT